MWGPRFIWINILISNIKCTIVPFEQRSSEDHFSRYINGASNAVTSDVIENPNNERQNEVRVIKIIEKCKSTPACNQGSKFVRVGKEEVPRVN